MKLRIAGVSGQKSRSVSPSSRLLTPKKFTQRSFKGLNLTIGKLDNKNLQETNDRTMTPISSARNSIFQGQIVKQMPIKSLWNNKENLQSPLLSQVRNNQHFSPLIRDYRNKSLPSFDFEKPLSGFSTSMKPYTKMGQYTSSFKKSTSPFSDNFSPYMNTTKKQPESHMNPISRKLSPAHSLNFDSPLIKSNYQTHNIKTSSFQQNSTKKQQSTIGKFYTIQTPKKSETSKEGSTLKNLRKKITQNFTDECPSTISSKGVFQSASKTDADFSLVQIKVPNNKFSNDESTTMNFKKKILTGQQSTPSKKMNSKDKQQFFNISPKVSQQFDIDIYDLTQSCKKSKYEESPYWKNIQIGQHSSISFNQPVKRKLALQKQNQSFIQQLNQSTILKQLLGSLNTNKKPEKKGPFNICLTRKCSQSVRLVRNIESNFMFGLLKLDKNQKFVDISDSNVDVELCVTKYCQHSNYIFVEPFEYTLEQIFQMKFIEPGILPELIKKFHKILNSIKEKQKSSRIDLKRLKQRIVYIHGHFKLIPIIQAVA